MDSASNSPSTSSERSPKLRHSSHSSMSLTSGSSLLDDQDEDVRIAVKALGDMRNGNIGSGKGGSRISTSTTPALSVSTSTTPATSIRSPTLSSPREVQIEQDFVSRVAHMPLVNGALKMYEQGKASSRVVKYGAEIMESGVKTISRPVIDRLPTGQLDDFACRQLDRLDRYRRPSHGASDGQAVRSPLNEREYRGRPEPRDDIDRWVRSTPPDMQNPSRSPTPTLDDQQQPLLPLQANLYQESMRRLSYVLQWLQYATEHIDHQILTIRDFAESLQQQYSDPSTVEGSPTTPTRNNPSGRTSGHSRSLSTSTHSRSSSETHLQAISEAHMHKLTSLRRDVVHTVRQVVSVVSKYGGSAALPEPARNAMKGFILMLPKNVGEAMRMGGPSADTPVGMGPSTGSASSSVSGVERDSVTAAASGRAGSERRTTVRRPRGDRGVSSSFSTAASPVPSRAASPTASPRIYPRSLHSAASSASEDQAVSGQGHSPPHTMSAGTAVVTAQRILTLATESLSMMHGVTEVVRDSLDRADTWIEKLRMVGVQRGSESSDAPGRTLSPDMDRGRMNFNLSSMQYRDHESDSALPSPLSTTLNLGSSRRGSIGSSAGYSYVGGSMPSTPGLSNYSYGYDGNLASGEAPSPEVGKGLRSMSIQGEEEETLVKKEDHEMVKMEVDI